MSSLEAIKRAKSHEWRELNDQTEHCIKCHLILSKNTNLEDVPGCTGFVAVKR